MGKEGNPSFTPTKRGMENVLALLKCVCGGGGGTKKAQQVLR